MALRIPSAEELSEIRSILGLSLRQMADFIGFAGHGSPDHMRFLEIGEKGGKPYVMTAPAAASLWRGIAILKARNILDKEAPAAAISADIALEPFSCGWYMDDIDSRIDHLLKTAVAPNAVTDPSGAEEKA